MHLSPNKPEALNALACRYLETVRTAALDERLNENHVTETNH